MLYVQTTLSYQFPQSDLSMANVLSRDHNI